MGGGFPETLLENLLAIVNYGGLPHERVLRSMERLAKEVMPAL